MAENSLWFECNAGISGDMAVAALLDAGADRGELDRALASIPAEGFSVEVKRVQKSGIDALDFDVKLDEVHENHDHDMDYLFGHEHGGSQHCHGGGHEHEAHEHEECGHHHDHDDGHGHEHGGDHHEHHQHEHRSLGDVLGIIGATDMSDGARELARSIFGIIAAAEGKAHNLPPDKVHFHEVGAVDSIVDVIALSVCFDNLRRVYGISRVYVPYLAEGTGTVRCQHGILPIPVPAVSNIVSEHGIPLRMIPDRGEFVTPTGAAFIAAVATDFRLPPELVVRRAGIGAGKRSYERTNILRVSIVQESPSGAGGDCIYKLESNIDDTTGEALGFVMERLLEAGARDVQYVPCYMKKNRPAYLLSVICTGKDIVRLEDIIFRHTTTIGIRRMRMERTVLERELLSVESAYGPAQVKKVILRDGEARFYPEYESVAEIVRRTGRAFADIYRELIGLCADQYK